MADTNPLIQNAKILFKLKEQKAELAKQTKEVNEEINIVEQAIATKLMSEGVTSAKTPVGTVVLLKNVKVSISGIETFRKFVIDTDSWDLLTKGVAKKAYTEMTEQGIDVPGVNVFERNTISLRKK